MDERESTDETYRAIGRYMVEFSHLVRHMRELMVLRAMTREKFSADPNIMDIAIAGAPAADTMKSFFGMCRYLSDFDNDERRVEESIRGRVREMIEERNDIAHGDWYIEAEGGPAVERLHAFRKEGHGETIRYSAAALNERADALAELTILVREFGEIALTVPYPSFGEPRGKPESVFDLRVKDVWTTQTTKQKQPDGTSKKETVLLRNGPYAEHCIRLRPASHTTRAPRLTTSHRYGADRD